MKISSRSILSPGRVVSGHDPQPISFSSSLSRRLRTSRSIKGAASPAMFPTITTGKKRGCGFDNPEPTSPKVTCIGQVRVKNKKKHTKNVRSLSKRRNTSGGVGFSKLEHSCSQRIEANNNQKWVHIPLTICEALRTFGSEVSCLFPCRSSCSSSIEKEEKIGNRQGTCAVFARWLVAMNDEDNAGEKREIELVHGNDNDNDNDNDNYIENEDIGRLRRHVFEDLEIVNDSVIGSKDEARVSICVPPKNALLLMRCRSDPMKMEALANRFWEPNLDQNDELNEDEGEDENECVHDENIMVFGEIIDRDIVEMKAEIEAKEGFREENVEIKQSIHEDKQSIYEEKQSIDGNEEDESMFLWCLFEEFEEIEEEQVDMVDALEDFYEAENFQEIETGESNVEKVENFKDSESGELKIEKVIDFEEEIEDMVIDFTEGNEIETNEEIVMELEDVENGVVERENAIKELPECLLLMMYEPKLSMEVSKETWVCSTDFIRRRKKPPPPPPPKVKSIGDQDESKVDALATKENDNDLMRMNVVPYEVGLHQPARSSCSLPTQLSMAMILEQKPVNRMRYEPLVLKRCKSEPMRNEATNLAPETCLWRNQLEPPRRASFGVGTTELGF